MTNRQTHDIPDQGAEFRWWMIPLGLLSFIVVFQFVLGIFIGLMTFSIWLWDVLP